LTAWQFVAGTGLAQTSSGTDSIADDCGDVFDRRDGVFDYTDPADWAVHGRIPIVLQYHFTPDVEALRKGNTGDLLADIEFTLRAIPNHHRAIMAVVRYEATRGIPPGRRSVQCWFNRALTWRPNDGMVWLLYGNYQAKGQQWEAALESYGRAKALLPDNVEVDYNLGLLYVKRGAYDKAVEHARNAYSKGYPLQGLRRQLAQKGYSVESD
jgi:tetratricopeptide (TPR) repeat protein